MDAKTLAAPGAAPGAAPVAAAATPAPSAGADKNLSLADYAERALKSMTAEPPAAAAPAAAPAGQEPSPATPEPPAAPAAPEPPAATPPAATPEDEPEIPEADQANWSEGEKRLYGALKKEREARKTAKAELKETRERLEALEAKADLNNKDAKTQSGKEPEAVAIPQVPGQPLAHCQSEAQVDVEVQEATRVELLTHDLQRALGRQDRASVEAALTAEGVKELNGKPLAEASEAELGDFISSAYKGARTTQAQANGRKVYLQQQAASATFLLSKIPALGDPKSAESKRFAEIRDGNPAFKIAGPNWPVVLGKYLAGELGLKINWAADAAKSSPSPKPSPPGEGTAKAVTAIPEIVPPAPTRKVPGAPALAGAPVAQESAADKARAKIHGSGATLEDVIGLTKAALSQ